MARTTAVATPEEYRGLVLILYETARAITCTTRIFTGKAIIHRYVDRMLHQNCFKKLIQGCQWRPRTTAVITVTEPRSLPLQQVFQLIFPQALRQDKIPRRRRCSLRLGARRFHRHGVCNRHGVPRRTSDCDRQVLLIGRRFHYVGSIRVRGRPPHPN